MIALVFISLLFALVLLFSKGGWSKHLLQPYEEKRYDLKRVREYEIIFYLVFSAVNLLIFLLKIKVTYILFALLAMIGLAVLFIEIFAKKKEVQD